MPEEIKFYDVSIEAIRPATQEDFDVLFARLMLAQQTLAEMQKIQEKYLERR